MPARLHACMPLHCRCRCRAGWGSFPSLAACCKPGAAFGDGCRPKPSQCWVVENYALRTCIRDDRKCLQGERDGGRGGGAWSGSHRLPACAQRRQGNTYNTCTLMQSGVCGCGARQPLPALLPALALRPPLNTLHALHAAARHGASAGSQRVVQSRSAVIYLPAPPRAHACACACAHACMHACVQAAACTTRVRCAAPPAPPSRRAAAAWRPRPRPAGWWTPTSLRARAGRATRCARQVGGGAWQRAACRMMRSHTHAPPHGQQRHALESAHGQRHACAHAAVTRSTSQPQPRAQRSMAVQYPHGRMPLLANFLLPLPLPLPLPVRAARRAAAGVGRWPSLDECCKAGGAFDKGCSAPPPTPCWLADTYWPARTCRTSNDVAVCNRGGLGWDGQRRGSQPVRWLLYPKPSLANTL